MQIKLNLQIFLFVVIFYFTNQIEIYVAMMIFATVHECAHIVAGILAGLKPKTLRIMPFGLSICFEKYKKNSEKSFKIQKIYIALAGPISNFILAILAYIFQISLLHISTETIVYANILIALFNLIPIYPLDGGRIVKYILQIFKKNATVITIINELSYFCIIGLTIIASIAILYYKNIAILMILLYLWIIVLQERRKNKLRLRVYKILEKT